jgi:(1->4)-alpha-D-glucan 1-alpha-D-glucosylmutase
VGPEPAILKRWDEGLPKLYLIRQALHLRRRHPEWFGAGAAGAYTPIVAAGPRSRHVVAYARGSLGAGRGFGCVTITPRFSLRLGGRWDGTALALPEGRWRNELSGATVAGGKAAVADLLGGFPVALLARIDE